MFKNNIKLILRNLWKNKVVSFINLTGLTIGIGCSLLLLMYVQFEHSYDSFMQDGDRIHRLILEEIGTDGRHIGLSGQTDVEDLKANYAGIEDVLQLRNNGYTIMPGDEVDKKQEVQSLFSSPNFFDFFDFPLVEGDEATVLNDPSSIVLTAKTAERLFGTTDVVGKTVTIDASSFKKELLVTGVAEDVTNSHIEFEAIIPWAMKAPDGRHIAHMWFQRSLFTYIKTVEGADLNSITQQKNKALVDAGEEDYAYYFQPLADIYLGSNHIQFLPFVAGNAQTVQTLFYIALIILVVACINYVNLQTAKGTRRSLEVGVRKVMGAHKEQLVRQFLVEALVLTVAASILAVLLVDLTLPTFNGLTGKAFTIQALIDNGLFGFLGLIALVTAVFSGIYPAFVLSSFKPSVVLKSAAGAGLGGKKARKTLIFLQFGISIFLIAVTLITFQQNRFMAEKDLGFNKEQVITFRVSTKNMQQSKEAFRREIDGYPGVVATSMGTDILGTGFTNNSGTIFSKLNKETYTRATIFGIDHDFIDTYDMELVSGRNFQYGSAADSGAVIVNEALVRALGFEDPLNEQVTLYRANNGGLPIIGVIKDFHFQRLHQEVAPVILRITPRNLWNLSVQVSPENMAGTLEFIESKWNEFERDVAFSYQFVDQQFARFYEDESRMQSAITFFSLVSIVLTALGLFGMTTFVIERKVKEIGIRKVLGASLPQINFLIFKEFGMLLVLAVTVATPIALFLGREWLNRFAYRMDIGVVPFATAAVVTGVIITVTVSLLSFRAAKANPVEALRNE